MTGIGSPVRISEADFRKAVDGEVSTGTSIGCGYRFACVEDCLDRRNQKEASLVYLAQGGSTGIRRMRITKGVFGLTKSEGPVTERDENYQRYLDIMKQFKGGRRE